MAFNDTYRISAHAVLTDENERVLLLKATYGDKNWGLPGGALDPGETVHEAVTRECLEELGVEIKILYMSGIYYHKVYNSHVIIFRCEMPRNSTIQLSDEHSDYQYFKLEELGQIQQHRIKDCLNFDGSIKSKAF